MSSEESPIPHILREVRLDRRGDWARAERLDGDKVNSKSSTVKFLKTLVSGSNNSLTNSS